MQGCVSDFAQPEGKIMKNYNMDSFCNEQTEINLHKPEHASTCIINVWTGLKFQLLVTNLWHVKSL